MKNHISLLACLAAAFTLLLAGCGTTKPPMPVTPMPDGGAPGAGPQMPASPATGMPASAPSVRPSGTGAGG